MLVVERWIGAKKTRLLANTNDLWPLPTFCRHQTNDSCLTLRDFLTALVWARVTVSYAARGQWYLCMVAGVTTVPVCHYHNTLHDLLIVNARTIALGQHRAWMAPHDGRIHIRPVLAVPSFAHIIYIIFRYTRWILRIQDTARWFITTVSVVLVVRYGPTKYYYQQFSFDEIQLNPISL